MVSLRSPDGCDHDQHLARADLNGCCRWCGEDLYRGFGSLAGMRTELFGRNVSYDPYMKRCELAALIDGSGGARCPATFTNGGRKYRCQSRVSPHEGMCFYRRRGGQGGSLTRWWGANPRPAGDTETMGYAHLDAEVKRLRALCEQHGVNWKAGLEASRS